MSSSEDEVKYIASLETDNSKIISVPEKSKEHYEAAYENFKAWMLEKKETSVDERCLLSYFEDLSLKYKPTTLWSHYSMLKCTLFFKYRTEVGKFSNLLAFLKQKSQGFQSKKFNQFTLRNIRDFVEKAPDDVYLTTKVVLLFGVAGGCGTEEFVSLKTKDVEEHGKLILVNIPQTKRRKRRSFTVTAKYAETVKKYIGKRPKKLETNRFFVNYHSTLSTPPIIGKNKFAAMPKEIATFLQLSQPELYTGNAFRRTATVLRKVAGSNVLDSEINQDSEEDSSSIKCEQVILPDDNIYQEVAPKRVKLETNVEIKEEQDKES